MEGTLSDFLARPSEAYYKSYMALYKSAHITTAWHTHAEWSIQR